MLTIQRFSDRSGLSPTTLRYYESVGLLLPHSRSDKGYREYPPIQINEARLISSLRQAEVRMSEIAEFLSSNADQRSEMLKKWRNDAAARLISVQVASHYL